jgi:hypothetical protein
MRSAFAKSRFLRASWRSATSASISASLGHAVARSDAQRAQFLGVIVAKHGEDGVESFHRAKHRAGVVLAEFAAIHGGVGFAYQIEDRRQRLRGVQVVLQSLLELILGRARFGS